MKRPASNVALLKRPAGASPAMKRPASVVSLVNRSTASRYKKTTRLHVKVRELLEKLEDIRENHDVLSGSLEHFAKDLDRLYREATKVGTLRSDHQLDVLLVAVRLGNYTEFWGVPLMLEILRNKSQDLDINQIDPSGRNMLLLHCEVDDCDPAGTWVHWDPIVILASDPGFACLDIFPDCHTMNIDSESDACIDEEMFLALIRRNRASRDLGVRASVNHLSSTWNGEMQTLLQIACGARSDSLDRNNLAIDSPEVVKALLEHPDFEMVNYVDGDESFSALHIVLSNSGHVAGAPGSREDRSFDGSGHHSWRHLTWDTKLAVLKVFLDYGETHPDRIDFTLRCGKKVIRIGDNGSPILICRSWLPAELAREAGFPRALVQRLENITLPGIPPRILVVPQIVQNILGFM